MKIVLDTSILISAAISKGSIPDMTIRTAFRDHEVIRSLPVTDELEVTLKKKKLEKYFENEYERDFFVHLFRISSTLITIRYTVSVCRDPSDNMFLDLGLSGKADCIVSSDPDLLVLHSFENIPIISPKEFLNLHS